MGQVRNHKTLNNYEDLTLIESLQVSLAQFQGGWKWRQRQFIFHNNSSS